MKGRRGFTLIELLVVIAIIAILAAILFPVFARVRKTALNSDCQSNMKQIGNAFKMYLGEWHDCYPYQDPTYTQQGDSDVSPLVRLSTPGKTIGNPPEPRRFEYAIVNNVFKGSWVEALFPYVEWISPSSAGAWACKAAADKKDKCGSLTWDANVTYVMNINLVAQPEGVIKTAANMMLCRETDRKMCSVLRPVNVSTDGTAASVPRWAFLTGNDGALKGAQGSPVNDKPHNMGSNVLFADGHVRNFPSSAMPETLSVATSYDPPPGDCQWFNFNDTCANKSLRKSIAISP